MWTTLARPTLAWESRSVSALLRPGSGVVGDAGGPKVAGAPQLAACSDRECVGGRNLGAVRQESLPGSTAPGGGRATDQADPLPVPLQPPGTAVAVPSLVLDQAPAGPDPDGQVHHPPPGCRRIRLDDRVGGRVAAGFLVDPVATRPAEHRLAVVPVS